MAARIVSMSVLLVVLLAYVADADLYMHNPRGGNNRLDEANRNRNNANRLFDSQNNNKGSYNVGEMEYIEGSKLTIEWTNQHSCNSPNNDCELVFQYMCDTANGVGIRDGENTDRITTNINTDDVSRGRHENQLFYRDCSVRQRNGGLFLADQENNLNGDEAIYTRQNTNGNRHGLECPEERDYYPYWHPTPWMDIAVLTDNPSRCPMYEAESQNVVDKGHCTGLKPADPNNPNAPTDGAYFNNPTECAAEGFTWVEDSKWDLPAPICQEAPWSRDNHLGNGLGGNANQLVWDLPLVDEESTCVLRMRYNITCGTYAYDAWTIDSSSNGANSPIEDNPEVEIATDLNLQLALNTDQCGRTFQDRSHTFKIVDRPADVPADAVIWNLNVKGQRGNIVQNYPSVEYAFIPEDLQVAYDAAAPEYVHLQWTGSNTSPDGAGNGRAQSDKTTFCETESSKHVYCMNYNKTRWFGNPETDPEAFHKIDYALRLDSADGDANDAPCHVDFGPRLITEADMQGETVSYTYHYQGVRNNDFTNRAQKGRIIISSEAERENPTTGTNSGSGNNVNPTQNDSAADEKAKKKTIGIVIGVAVGVVVVAIVAVALFAAAAPNSGIGKFFRSFGGGSSPPKGYS